MSYVEIVLIAVVSCIVFYYVGTFLFKKDTEIENRRRAAAKLAGILRSLGLSKTPEFLEDYAVGDYSGMAEKIKELVKLFLSGQDAVVAEYSKVFDAVLAAKLSTEAGRAFIAAKLEEATKPNDVAAVQDAPKATTV